jgi:hypothetical protein
MSPVDFDPGDTMNSNSVKLTDAQVRALRVKLTDAQVRALRILAAHEKVRESSRTYEGSDDTPEADPPTVSWQTGYVLADKWLADRVPVGDRFAFILRSEGRQVLAGCGDDDAT